MNFNEQCLHEGKKKWDATTQTFRCSSCNRVFGQPTKVMQDVLKDLKRAKNRLERCQNNGMIQGKTKKGLDTLKQCLDQFLNE